MTKYITKVRMNTLQTHIELVKLDDGYTYTRFQIISMIEQGIIIRSAYGKKPLVQVVIIYNQKFIKTVRNNIMSDNLDNI